MRLTLYYLNTNQNDLAIKTLDQMDEKIPHRIRKMPMGLQYEVANLYLSAGAKGKYEQYAKEVESMALAALEKNPEDIRSYYNPYRILIDIYENLKEYKKSYELWERLQLMYPNDPSVKANVEKYRRLSETNGNENSKDSSAKVK